MGEIIFKTELIKGAKGDRGEAGQADSIPTDGVIAFQGETVPDGYEETDPGDVFDEVYEDINAVKDMISDEYDTTATYNAGDFCIHENALYKCTATTTGLWDSSKWELTSISDETKANTSAINGIKDGININSFGAVESAISPLRMKYINRYANSVPMSIIETGKIYMFIPRLLGDNYWVSSGIAIVTTWRGNATQTLSPVGAGVTWSNADNKYSPSVGGNIYGIEIDVYEL